jgi:RNA polymerase sigma-70 factor (ECF subfamily)
MASRLQEGIAAAATTERGATGSATRREVEGQVVSLFERLRDRLLRYLISSGLPAYESEEIIQEAFLALFHHLELERPRINLEAWLFRVVHNLGLKHRAQLRKSLAALSDTDLAEDCASDPRPTVEAKLANLQREEQLRRLVRSLPDQDQRCLALRAEGLRYREIAEILKMSLGAVSISLARSLARLGRALERSSMDR